MELINRFTLLQSQLATLPVDKQTIVLNQTMQKIIPIFGTLGLTIVEWHYTHCSLRLPNTLAVQNGWGSIQAGGIYTAAESAMALAIGANLSDNQIVVAKSVAIEYLKKAKGSIQTKAILTTDQIDLIRTQGKGELNLHADIFDEEHNLVGICKATWIWHEIKK